MANDTLDDKDRLLIGALRKNARASLVTLAKDIGLSRSATHDRMVRMEANGVIKRYTVDVSKTYLPSICAFLTVLLEPNAAQNAIVNEMQKMAGVEAAFCLSGDIDLMVYCECSSSTELSELRDVIAARDGVIAIQTRIILADSRA
ncbi:MAG: Lrp/AsnC family transcriptional regulator [Pseudomonadota bacterium]